MDENEKIFISHSHEDEEITKQFFDFIHDRWPKFEIYYSIKPKNHFEENYVKECFNNCRAATLGIIILSEQSMKSPAVLQEMGCLVGCEIDRYYISLSKQSDEPPAMESKHRTFPLYKCSNPYVGFNKIVEEIETEIFYNDLPKKLQLRKKFNKMFMDNKSYEIFENRDPCALLESFKCAESEIKITGENALQPIHGGFETLYTFLKEGGSVKVLIADYNAPEIISRQKFEGAEKTRRIRSDWIASVSNLIHLYHLNPFKDHPEQWKLEVKYTDDTQFGSLIIIDDWHLQYNPYDRISSEKGKRGFHSKVFLYNNEHPRYKEYYNEFDIRWQAFTSQTLHLEKIDLTSIVPEKIVY